MIEFGTGGWRAKIGEEFTKENVQLLAQALANLILEQEVAAKGFVIGHDRRFLSDKAAKWVAEVLSANQIKVYFIQKISPTPLIMHTVKEYGSFYGAAITASHNPADYNGVKLFTKGGRDATEEITNEIEKKISRLNLVEVKFIDFEKAKEKNLVKIIDPFNNYIDTIISMLDTKAIKASNMKILLDPMFGVSKTSLQTILITARCEVDTINDRHDTLFGGRLPSPNNHTLNQLKNMVIESDYDLGIGTDGDADRLGIIDEKGNFIHPNEILALLYYYLLEYKGWTGGVVRNVATTHLLDKIAAYYGEECYEVPVGFKHISSTMEAKNALIGGESSGGLTIRGHIKGKDGIFAASILIEMLSVTNKKLSELLTEIQAKFGKFAAAESDLEFTVKEKAVLIQKLFVDKKFPEFKYGIKDISYQDGVKVYFENDGWIIVRFSGTEPLLRIFSEMKTRAKAKELILKMKNFLEL
ncbi:phosphoglucomutase/phosphomannomutase family protein [Halanaerobium praevalens]|uniref:Phosphoglucomutase n=1 Tax=Halanaerobium praevalens (strain ATCC 33744 / DSM 2228 / GSL) TaxID=572479 RepID=E3DMU9_HALPG|nr:phosphoglucomutase/phosphomannomutase family protein [Halanaerobium praevalens]ADO77438.1 phosphoglucomutase/phosphomannomutase alpha/beta/alpha domain I [Halanaerobium praevalens DSM 2228]